MKRTSQIIMLCGGTRPLAKAIGKSSSTVGSWKERGCIPAKYDLTIIRIAKSRGATVTLEDLAAARDEKLRRLDMGTEGELKSPANIEISEKREARG